MSYNIDSIDILEGSVTITLAQCYKVTRLVDETAEEDKVYFPECHFIEELIDKAGSDADLNEPIEVERFWWYGEGSGHSWERLFKPYVVQELKGRIVGVCTWEGGDSHSGFIIEEGEYTEGEVKMTVVPKED